MNKTFKANLSLLEQYDPALAARLRSHVPTGRAEVFCDPNCPNPTIRLNTGQRAHLLHSSRDPLREAIRFVDSLQLGTIYNFMVFGCGLMYHVFQIAILQQKTLRNAIIVEKEFDVVHALFSTIDLAPFLQTRSTWFLVDADAIQMRDLINRFLTPLTLDGLSIIEHPSSVEVHKDYYTELRQVVDESLQSAEILLRTKVQLGGMIQENIVRNLPAVLSNPTASGLSHILSQIPAFVVGAGPSLDKNVEQLRQVGDCGVIIAVDTVFKKLLRLGIKPHMVVTSDPTYLNARHFEGITDLDGSILVFSPSVYHEIPKQLTGVKVSVPLPASRFLRVLQKVMGNMSYMKTGINVGQTCFNLARHLGCDPIILTGMDLSFSAAGGSTHASDTALRRSIYLSETPGKMKVELISDKPELEEFDPIKIPGNLGGEVATSKFWLAYLRSLEEEVRLSQVRVINATEGGARVTGTEITPLSQAIRLYCTRDAMVSSTLQMAVGFFFGLYTNEGREVLKNGIEILQKAIEKSEEGQAKIVELEAWVGTQETDPTSLMRRLEEITEIHKALIQDQSVYAVLDEAADQILTPFLRQENRPQGINETTPENLQKTITRYKNYFTQMQPLCKKFQTVFQETLDTLDDSSPSFSF